LEDDVEADGSEGEEDTWQSKGQKHQRGTEEDMYCWD
jgi:hypothetical protein